MYPFGCNWFGLDLSHKPTPEGVRPRTDLGEGSGLSKPYVFQRQIGKIREYGQTTRECYTDKGKTDVHCRKRRDKKIKTVQNKLSE